MYDDATIRVDAEGVTIKRYYFPLGRSKHISFDEIAGVDVQPAGLMAKWRLWGSNNLTNWMPLDNRRPGKDQLVEFDIGRRIKPTVTPDDPERVVALVRERL